MTKFVAHESTKDESLDLINLNFILNHIGEDEEIDLDFKGDE